MFTCCKVSLCSVLSKFVRLSVILINQSKLSSDDNGESLRQFIIKFEFKTEKSYLNLLVKAGNISYIREAPDWTEQIRLFQACPGFTMRSSPTPVKNTCIPFFQESTSSLQPLLSPP